jgi:CheY-like chemotaxis protein
VQKNKPNPQKTLEHIPVAEISLMRGTEATDPQAAGERRRILVVEDNRDAADSLRLLLELMGHEVRVAHSGPEGVKAAQEWRPAIVLCDIGLPGMDGFAVAEELRRHPGLASTRLIAVTGYGQEDDRRHSRESGFDHHLVKPVDPEELQRVLLSA